VGASAACHRPLGGGHAILVADDSPARSGRRTALWTAAVASIVHGLNFGRCQALRALDRAARSLDFRNAPSPAPGPDRSIIWANAELEMMGVTAREYLGHHVGQFHGMGVSEDILLRLRRGESITNYPVRLRRPDGRVLDVLIDADALRTAASSTRAPSRATCRRESQPRTS
jgi:hypothetical protein